MYQYDKEHLEIKKAADYELSQCKTFTDLQLLLTKAADHNLRLVSRRRPGVQIYHILAAGIKRNGKDLAMYLVDDGVHAGACAVPNLHRHFKFVMTPPGSEKPTWYGRGITV